MYPHRIRLRGPWECQPLTGSAVSVAMPLRMTMPCRLRDGGLAGFAGRVRLRRRFGYPGRIDAEERVWLTMAGLSDRAEVSLNGEVLGGVSEAACPWEHDVTRLLGQRNELLVSLEVSSDAGGLWSEVALEIRRTAFLQNLRAGILASADGDYLSVMGKVVGSSDRPLDAYALIDGKVIAYTTVQPREDGQFFVLRSGFEQDQKPDAATVRVDLIDGGVVWYAAEVPLPGPFSLDPSPLS